MLAELAAEVRERAAKIFSGGGDDPRRERREKLRTQADLDRAIAEQRETNAAYDEYCRKIEAGETYKGNAAGKPLYTAKRRADALVEAITKEVNERADLAPLAMIHERRRLSKTKVAAIVKIKNLKEQIEAETLLMGGHLNEVESRQETLRVCQAYQRAQVKDEIERAKNRAERCQIEINRLIAETEAKAEELAALEIQHAAIIAEQRN